MNDIKNIKNSFEIPVNFLCEMDKRKIFLPLLYKLTTTGKNRNSKTHRRYPLLAAVAISENQRSMNYVEKMEGIRIFQKDEAGTRQPRDLPLRGSDPVGTCRGAGNHSGYEPRQKEPHR